MSIDENSSFSWVIYTRYKLQNRALSGSVRTDYDLLKKRRLIRFVNEYITLRVNVRRADQGLLGRKCCVAHIPHCQGIGMKRLYRSRINIRERTINNTYLNSSDIPCCIDCSFSGNGTAPSITWFGMFPTSYSFRNADNRSDTFPVCWRSALTLSINSIDVRCTR